MKKIIHELKHIFSGFLYKDLKIYRIERQVDRLGVLITFICDKCGKVEKYYWDFTK